MEDKLKVIYTPDASRFRRDPLEPELPENEISRRLRADYQKLQQRVGGLPKKIGVIATFPYIYSFFEATCEREEHELPAGYAPLHLLRKMLELRAEENLESSLNREYIYRTLMFAFMHPVFSMGKNPLPNIFEEGKICTQGTVKNVLSILEKAKEQFPKDMRSDRDRYLEMCRNWPDWDYLENTILARIQRQLKKNKVSEDFPLRYLQTGLVTHPFHIVSIEDKVETPEYVKQILPFIEAGFTATQASPEERQRILASLKQYDKDKFGETKEVASLAKLLADLPSPRTIITDLYIVDHFPELEEMDFEALEIVV